jgi:hypothetical protein
MPAHPDPSEALKLAAIRSHSVNDVDVGDGLDLDPEGRMFVKAADASIEVSSSGIRAPGGDGVAPVSSMFYSGTRTPPQLDSLISPYPFPGMVVVSGGAGTPAAGSSDLLATGDVAEFDLTGSWKKIISNVAGFPPAGTRLGVSFGLLYAPAANKQGNVAEFGGASLTPTFTELVDSAEVLCLEQNVFSRQRFRKIGTGVSSVWREISPNIWSARKTSSVVPPEVSPSWGEALSFTPPLLPAGRYEVKWSVLARVSNDAYSAYLRVRADDATVIGDENHVFRTPNGSSAATRIPYSGSDTVDLTSNVHVIDLDVAREHTDGQVWVYFSRLSIVRVSP